MSDIGSPDAIHPPRTAPTSPMSGAAVQIWPEGNARTWPVVEGGNIVIH